VIASIFKIGPKIVDFERGEVIARMAGFDTTDGSLDLTTSEGEAVAHQPAQAPQSHSNIHPIAPVRAH